MGDPLSLDQTPLVQLDTTIFQPVPEPAAGLLLCLAAAYAAIRSRSTPRNAL